MRKAYMRIEALRPRKNLRYAYADTSAL